MGFLPNLDKAPSTDHDRKTGFARLWEILSRDLKKFFGSGFLALAGCTPFILGAVLSLDNHVLLYAALLGLIGGMLAGPELCCLADTVLRSLRDEPGFWWHTYRRVWKRNAAASLLPGAAGGLLLGTQLFLLLHAGALGLSTAMGGALVAGILIVLELSLYVWPQLALMELSFPQLLKNAGLLFLGQLPRSIAALAILTVYCGGILRFFTLAVTLLPFTNLWIPVVPALLLIYPGLESSFQIEKRIKALDTTIKEPENSD